MKKLHNPYATALDGLEIPDPVAAFFGFCREREGIRILRESGAPAPWSEDPIFQRGRFLNVFREDDRSSKAIVRFAAPVADDLPRLIHALFFARWCNRQSTLDVLSAEVFVHVFVVHLKYGFRYEEEKLYYKGMFGDDPNNEQRDELFESWDDDWDMQYMGRKHCFYVPRTEWTYWYDTRRRYYKR